MKKLIFILLALAITLGVQAQTQYVKFYQPLGTLLETDTVTNTATNYVTTPILSAKPAAYTSIVVVVTKISGTVGGTITLMGSIDGTNFTALNTEETSTALATKTAADASAVLNWRIKGSYYAYYRVSWAGTGTMAATLAARLYRN